MIRSTVTRSIRQGYTRPLSRRTLPTPLLQQSVPSISPNATARRTLFTRAKPTIGSRSRSFVTRVGLAVAFIWWYNTGGVWAEEPVDKQPVISRAPPVAPVPEERFASLDELEAERKKKREQKKEEKKGDGASETAVTEIEGGRSPESLEEEAGQQGAFNEETGEINWDCPCLGGMAHGPCGEEFRAAFSCFVFSKEEPKGVDCIEKFKGMQTCFQKYPEIYGDPPADDDDDDEEDEIDRKIAELDDKDSSKPSAPSSSGKPSKEPTSTDSSPRPAPETKGTEEYSHDAPKDNADSKDGTLSHPSPGEKGIGGGSHEGPVDTDSATAGLIRPAPSSSGVDGAVKGHGVPGVKGVGGATGPGV